MKHPVWIPVYTGMTALGISSGKPETALLCIQDMAIILADEVAHRKRRAVSDLGIAEFRDETGFAIARDSLTQTIWSFLMSATP